MADYRLNLDTLNAIAATLGGSRRPRARGRGAQCDLRPARRDGGHARTLAGAQRVGGAARRRRRASPQPRGGQCDQPPARRRRPHLRTLAALDEIAARHGPARPGDLGLGAGADDGRPVRHLRRRRARDPPAARPQQRRRRPAVARVLPRADPVERRRRHRTRDRPRRRGHREVPRGAPDRHFAAPARTRPARRCTRATFFGMAADAAFVAAGGRGLGRRPDGHGAERLALPQRPLRALAHRRARSISSRPNASPANG